MEERGPPLTTLIIDASAAAPFLFVDEAADQIVQVSSALALGDCAAPAIWSFELANMIWKGVRSKRLTESEASIVMDGLREWNVEIDTQSIDASSRETLRLALTRRLTVYDAAYLELALRLRCDLATGDRALAAAARAEGVNVFSPRSFGTP